MKDAGFSTAHGGMVIWAALIASSFFAAGYVSQAVDPVLLTGLRLLFSALLFLPILLVKGNLSMSMSRLRCHCVLGLLLAVYFGSLFEALRYTSAVHTATLYTLVPLMTLCFEVALMQGMILKGRVFPMLTAAVGAVLLIVAGSHADATPSLYALVVYGVGCLAMALYSPLSQRYKLKALSDTSPVAMTFWNMLFGALFLLLIAAVTGGWRTGAELVAIDVFWLFYLALFGTLGTFWLLHRAIGVIGSSTVISYVYLSTLFVTLSRWFLGEQPVSMGVTGALLVLLGMVALVLKSRQRKLATA
ncbi:DMT family transporter [Pseudomonas alliivorans]|nr:DMT family transporter [Pseudomonas alliivorans]MEE4961367.1 DMT family transporter [Pseudomonas alliivorans]MEE4974354.1 DMT family transporter [Pseudomonas alliivorans]MEE4979606.1 DMT family transporter [Pseudomonas alliivorans]MEE4982534.1 DMT family transporter [Pseudomonas alliivorans]